MSRHSLQPFRMKYLEPEKGDTFTGFMLFSMSSMGRAPTKLHASTDSRQGPLNIGFTGFSPTALLDYGKGSAQVAPVGFLPQSSKGYETKYGVPPENWDMTKTCGMVCCCLTISKSITLSPSVCDNVKGCSISSDLPYKGLADRLVRPILYSRRHSKKLLPMDERPQYSALVRRRSPFPTTQQFDTDVGPQGSTTSRVICLNSSEGGLLRGTQPENRLSTNQSSPHIQCRDLWRVSLSSSPICPGEAISYSGQRQLAQSARFEKPFRRESRPSGSYFPATLLTRTQSNRTSVENHSQAAHPQPLFRIDPRARNDLDFSFCKMGAAK